MKPARSNHAAGQDEHSRFRRTWRLSLRQICMPIKTPVSSFLRAVSPKIKRPRWLAVLGTINPDPVSFYFAGGVVVEGFVAGAVGRVVPSGLVVVPAAGAGTPDCAL